MTFIIEVSNTFGSKKISPTRRFFRTLGNLKVVILGTFSLTDATSRQRGIDRDQVDNVEKERGRKVGGPRGLASCNTCHSVLVTRLTSSLAENRSRQPELADCTGIS